MASRIVSCLLLALAPAAAAAPAADAPAIHEIDCGFRLEGIRLQCGYIEVPENRSREDGRVLPIHFVRARATGERPAPDPLILLGGGPGLNATPHAAGPLNGMRDALRTRDVVVVDQRGTGRSNPLDCSRFDDSSADTVRALFERPFFDPEEYAACAERLAAVADLTQYTTTASAADVEDLRRALGAERVNLHGGSYGTRWALEFLRRYPASTRTAVLIGVAPPGDLLVPRVARDLERNVERLLADCAAEAKCAAAFPDLKQQLSTAARRLAAKPQPATVETPGGESVEVSLSYETFVTSLRFSMYSVDLSSQLPARIAQAASGNYDAVAGPAVGLSLALKNQVSEGLWASVICTEEMPQVDLERARERSAGTLLGTLRLDSTARICARWPRGEVPGDYHQPVRSDVPVLLVAGELDVASAPDLAERAASSLPNSLLVVVANRSHWGLSGPCVDGLVERFLERGSVEGLDAGCAAEHERPPFFVP